jgi:hypothetical protein
MTNWEFEPHVAMNTINATSKCNKKAMIKFPQFLGRTSSIYKNRKNKHSYLYEFSDLKKTEMKENKQTTKTSTTKKSKKSESVNKEKKPRGRPKKNIST